MDLLPLSVYLFFKYDVKLQLVVNPHIRSQLLNLKINYRTGAERITREEPFSITQTQQSESH